MIIYRKWTNDALQLCKLTYPEAIFISWIIIESSKESISKLLSTYWLYVWLLNICMLWMFW